MSQIIAEAEDDDGEVTLTVWMPGGHKALFSATLDDTREVR